MKAAVGEELGSHQPEWRLIQARKWSGLTAPRSILYRVVGVVGVVEFCNLPGLASRHVTPKGFSQPAPTNIVRAGYWL